MRRRRRAPFRANNSVNHIRNPSGAGAVVGSPGTLPTNWSFTPGTTGITQTVVGTGIEDNIPYVDLRFNGTPVASASPFLEFDVTAAVPAVNGQAWKASMSTRVVAGSLTNITGLIFAGACFDSGSAFLNNLPSVGITINTGGITIGTQRQSALFTINIANTAFLVTPLQWVVTISQPFDVTFRIGNPALSTAG